MHRIDPTRRVLCWLLALLPLALPAAASSHREAPFITEMPKVDGTDFYLFRSYEPGRDGYVTLVANYIPLEDPYGGPNYFTLDPQAEYLIHLDNTGDGVEDVTFAFQFQTLLRGIALPVGGLQVPIPLVQAGVIDQAGAVNQFEIYRLSVLRGAVGERPVSRQAKAETVRDAANGGRFFPKALDDIGGKTFPDYGAYAAQQVRELSIPGCGAGGRVFVGQRKDPFVVNLGEVFDLINFDPVGPRDGEGDDLADKNVTSLVLEVPVECVTEGRGDVVGGWTTARLPRNRFLSSNPTFQKPEVVVGPMVQVSRLGMPLVNEVVIGLPDKNLFNSVRPKVDAALATYVTNPTLPELIELLFGSAGVRAPDNFPRLDLVAAFATGIEGLNLLTDGKPHEMLRLNTSVAATPRAQQSDLGVLGGDLAGFPNGRRPGDDVVDIELRVAMGVLCHAFPGAFGCGPADAPSGTLPYTDGALVTPAMFPDTFPYLNAPIPGSPR
jgi:hypothetical protein